MKILNSLAMLLAAAPTIKATPALPQHEIQAKNSTTGFEATLVEKTDDPDSYSGKGKTYKIHLKNTGEAYIKSFMLEFPTESENSRYSSYGTEFPEFVSDDSVLAPGQETDVYVSANYNASSLDDFYMTSIVYGEFTDEVKVTGGKTITVYDYGEGQFQYRNTVDLKFDKENDRYCYGAIIKVNVEDNDYYFEVNLCENFTFYSSVNLKEYERKEVEVVKVLKCEYSHYRQSKSNPFVIFPILILLAVSIPFLVIGGLIVLVVVLAVRSRKKYRID